MKKVLVTGATGDIGSAIVEYFANNGYFVYIHYHNSIQKAKELLGRVEHAELISFDVSKKSSIKEALNTLEDVDVLVNCAGIIRDKLLFFMEDKDFEDVIDVNLNGLFFVTREVVKKMIRNKKGSVVNVASISGVIGNFGQANYSASKGGVIAFTKALCAELGQFGIRVNAVAPGFITSNMTSKVEKKRIEMIPLNREGTCEEVAEVVFFLADKASYISGEVINISGGMIR